MRILLVEDDAPLGEALSAGLRGLDYAVDWVQSGESADTALRLAQYDAVLLDCMAWQFGVMIAQAPV